SFHDPAIPQIYTLSLHDALPIYEFHRSGGTPTDLIATACYAYSAGLVAKAARVLGEKKLAKEYERLSKEVKQAFCEEFVTPRGRLVVNTQTAHILALFMDLVPDKLRKRILDSLDR